MKDNAQRLLSEWACTIGDVVLRTVWIALVAVCTFGLMKACSWADEGSRPVPAPALLPSERANDINHGRP